MIWWGLIRSRRNIGRVIAVILLFLRLQPSVMMVKSTQGFSEGVDYRGFKMRFRRIRSKQMWIGRRRDGTVPG